MPLDIRWIGHTKRPHSRSIPPERWSHYKDEIVQKYAQMRLEDVKRWMEVERHFYAS